MHAIITCARSSLVFVILTKFDAPLFYSTPQWLLAWRRWGACTEVQWLRAKSWSDCWCQYTHQYPSRKHSTLPGSFSQPTHGLRQHSYGVSAHSHVFTHYYCKHLYILWCILCAWLWFITSSLLHSQMKGYSLHHLIHKQSKQFSCPSLNKIATQIAQVSTDKNYGSSLWQPPSCSALLKHDSGNG